MKDAEVRKALLLTRIEAHRQILRLEVRCARATLDPWRLVVPRLVGALVALVDRVVEGGPSAPEGGGGAGDAGGTTEGGASAARPAASPGDGAVAKGHHAGAADTPTTGSTGGSEAGG